jgi:hypothetical protein
VIKLVTQKGMTANRATLFIRNLGGDNVTLVTAYVLRPGTVNPLCTVSEFTIYKPDGSEGARTLYPGRVQRVTFNLPQNCGVQSGRDYVIKLVTQKGTEFAVTVTAS